MPIDDDRQEKPNRPPPDEMRSPVILPVRCRDCYHFQQRHAPDYADVCEKLGVQGIARPCSKFLPNAMAFDVKSADGKDLREYIGHVPTARLNAIAALIVQEARTRRLGFHHGELVYVRMFGGDYLSNYFRAYVIMANRRYVFVQGRSGFKRGSFLATSVLDAEDFARKRKALIARKQLIDPKLSEHTSWKPPTKVDVNYEPPVWDGMLPAEKKKKRPANTSRHKELDFTTRTLRQGSGT